MTATRNPNSDQCGGYIEDGPNEIINYDYAEVRFTTRSVLVTRCHANERTVACAPLSSLLRTAATLLQSPTQAIPDDVDILFDETHTWRDVNYLADGTTCTRLWQFAIHESGHAFGVRLDHTRLQKSVMRSSVPIQFCLPQPFDILNFMAIYQSNDPE